MVVRRTLAAIGRMLVTIGLLILLFVSYELWGTGIFTARDQSRLKSQFHKELALAQPADNPVVTAPTTPGKPHKPAPTTSTTINPKFEVAPPEGGIIGEIVIKKIGVDWIFREGVQLADLAQGPGHYPGTPLPGQIGNAAIAGHRTTHGAPFFRVNELAPGDQIHITTFAGSYTYVVYKQLVVDPTDYGVVANTPDAELTLTSCNPRYSASQRIVIKAKLVRKLSDKPHKPLTHINGKTIAPPAPEQLATSLRGESNSDVPSVEWGIIVAVVGALWWWAFRRWRHPLTWVIGVIPFLVVLFPFYVYLERALPNGY
jgi:sortase A